MPQGQGAVRKHRDYRRMAATAANVSVEIDIGFDDGAGLEAPLECPEYSKEAEEILEGRTSSFFIFRIFSYIVKQLQHKNHLI